MCGIAGEIRWDGAAADVSAVSKMTDELERRGPDGSGVWASGPVALGHRRLAIIDTSPHAAQPMTDAESGLTVVFNGCIYNYRELRAELISSGHRFFSNSDTEVLLRAYKQWGDRFVEHLHGMFACCIAERDSGRTVLARDRLGIKPIYLWEQERSLRFASTLPALLAPGGVSTDIDPIALQHYLSLHGIIPAPRSIYRAVRKLPPATVLTIEPDGRRQQHTYWDPAYERDPADAGMTEHDWEDAVLAGLRTAVERRRVADVPVGVLLSGGLDSSLIVGLLAEAGQRDLQTFSIGFESSGGEAGNEFVYSDLVAERFGTNHHQLRVPTGNMIDSLRQAVAHMSEPLVSHDAIGFYLLSEAVSQHVKVVQSGQGADEIFAGYYWHEPFGSCPLDKAPEVFADVFYDRTRAELDDTVNAAHAFGHDAVGELVLDDMGRPGVATALDAVQRFDIGRLMPDDPVKRVDNMTMAWGLEARVPFLDHELVELAARCPPELKLAHGGKGVLKQAARRVLPAEVIDRPKGYFPVPALRSISGPVLELARETLLNPAARQRGLFRPSYVEQLLADPNGSRTIGGSNPLWQLTMLELWIQTHDR
jgi:asparagine synthase (glutamine-hydrolysing)